jgi:hypothetical protein
MCGIDWASDHRDVALIDREGTKPGRRRISDDAAGLGELVSLFAARGGGPGTVQIAIETERGLLTVPALSPILDCPAEGPAHLGF